MVKRYQRDYTPVQIRPVDTASQYGQIQNALSGFTSTTVNAVAQAYGRKNMAETMQQVRNYDPTTGAPVLSDRGNKAALFYNQSVQNAYLQSVQNDAVKSLGVMAEEYKNRPDLYTAAANARRQVLIKDSGPLAGVASRQFDQVSSHYEATIRKGVMQDSLAAAKQVEDDTFTAQRQTILESITDTNFDEVRIERTINDYDLLIDGSVNYSDLEKVNAKRSIRQDVWKATGNAVIQDFIDQDDIAGAQKYIKKTRNRQVTDGSQSTIKKNSGWTPVQSAESMQSYLQDYADSLALEIKIGNDQDNAVEAEQVVANEKANKDLVALGTDITLADVNAVRGTLSPTEYKQWTEVAGGKVNERNVVSFNGLFADMNEAIIDDNFEQMNKINNDAIALVREGRISKSDYDSLVELSDASRFDAGYSVFTSVIESIKVTGGSFYIPQVAKAQQAFLAWKRKNPEATTEEAQAEAEKLFSQLAPQANSYMINLQANQQNQ